VRNCNKPASDPLPDARCYVSVRHRVLGIAAEMIDWWFSWAKRADLHYKIWFPGLHYANRVTRPSPEDALRFERFLVTSGRLTGFRRRIRMRTWALGQQLSPCTLSPAGLRPFKSSLCSWRGHRDLRLTAPFLAGARPEGGPHPRMRTWAGRQSWSACQGRYLT
jgi:DAPG hydrolase PhiG domain